MQHARLISAILCGGLLQGAALAAQTEVASDAGPAKPGTGATQGTAAAGTASGTAAGPTAVSEVRIVRLSQVRGEVQLDRATGRGYEGAFANIPVTRGSKLRTGQGVAEVEFEDNSSLRLAPNSVMSFSQLSRTATGTTLSTVKLESGTAYVSLAKSKGNLFTLEDGEAKIDVSPGTHLRLEASGAAPEDHQAKLAIFEGDAQFEGVSGPSTVAKKQTLTFSPDGKTAPMLASKTEEQPLDGWDKTEQSYHKQAASFAGSGGSALYGANDLNYYGSFADLPGCGNAWRPYFASASFDPFANGMYAWYPGAGYSWVSPYPWGWLPFHTGSWQQCGNAGWAWQPGGSFVGLSNTVLRKLPKGVTGPTPLPKPPAAGHPTLVPVNTRPLTASGLTNEQSFLFRTDSAGLGVPRHTFGKLGSMSSSALRTGSATAAVSAPVYSMGNASSRPNQIAVPGSLTQRSGGVAPRSAPSAPMAAPGMHTSPGMSSPAMSAPSGMSSAHAGGGGSHR